MQLFETKNTANKELTLAYLQNKINLNPAKLEQILRFYSSINQAIEDNFEELKKINPKWLQKYKPQNFIEEITKLQEVCEQNEIKIIDFEDPKYPKSLKILNNFPLVLYYQGDINALSNTSMITVVGSRQVDTYSQFILPSILNPVCHAGIGIVSGLALGLDTLAHQIALNNKACTVGILGGGLSKAVFYPSQNWKLGRDIVENKGCIVSEYSPMTSPNIYTFPQRNRLLASLTDLTWVVQASVNSGSLITSVRARDIGKTVATTPADIRNTNFDGNLQLIKQGASIITNSQDIFDLLGLKTHPEITPKTTIQFSSKEEEKVYQQLSINPQTIDSLVTKCNLTFVQINTSLSLLELNDLVVCVGQNEWIKNIN
jgi:DNA processing protein